MEIVQILLNTEEVSYASNLNEERLKKKIEDLFEQSTLRVAGRLTSENEFTVYDTWIVMGWDMPNLKRKAAYLYGIISKREKGTLLKLKVKPNSFLPVFSILSTLIGVVISLIAVSNTNVDKLFFILGLAFLALGVIYYPLSTLLRNRLRNKIVKYLDLNKV